jgi:hypothetical protein
MDTGLRRYDDEEVGDEVGEVEWKNSFSFT